MPESEAPEFSLRPRVSAGAKIPIIAVENIPRLPHAANDDAKRTIAEYSDWIIEHRQQIPNWFPIDTAREAFAATYPLHPSAGRRNDTGSGGRTNAWGAPISEVYY